MRPGVFFLGMCLATPHRLARPIMPMHSPQKSLSIGRGATSIESAAELPLAVDLPRAFTSQLRVFQNKLEPFVGEIVRGISNTQTSLL